jgi:hypothetical protein
MGAIRDEPEKDDAPPPPSDYAKDRQMGAEQASRLQQYEHGWLQLCTAGGGFDRGGECMFRHERAFKEMVPKLTTGTEEQRAKATRCFKRWYKETIGVVDASMWQYCYVN